MNVHSGGVVGRYHHLGITPCMIMWWIILWWSGGWWMMVNDGEWWWMMVNDGEWWWMMVNDGEWWWMMVNDGEWWWMMVNDGEWWWMMVNDGEWWWMVHTWWYNTWIDHVWLGVAVYHLINIWSISRSLKVITVVDHGQWWHVKDGLVCRSWVRTLNHRIYIAGTNQPLQLGFGVSLGWLAGSESGLQLGFLWCSSEPRIKRGWHSWVSC